MTKLQKQVVTHLPNYNWQLDHELSKQAYFKIGGPAEIYLEIDDLKKLPAVISFCTQNEIPLTMLGGASNVLIADAGIKGVVVKIVADAVSFEADGKVTAEAGIKTSLLVRKTIDQGLTGLEKFLGVPGTLGGAIYNNSHYLNELIGNYVTSVTAITRQGELKEIPVEECHFDYDASRFQTSQEIIIAATFQLEEGNQTESQQIIKEATVYRARTQPHGKPSSGCIFQNVPNTAELRDKFPQFKDNPYIGGGFLIDQAGLKGRTVGDVSVSQKHAAFIINHGNGTMDQVTSLIEIIKKEVQQKFGVELHEEVIHLQ